MGFKSGCDHRICYRSRCGSLLRNSPLVQDPSDLVADNLRTNPEEKARSNSPSLSLFVAARPPIANSRCKLLLIENSLSFGTPAT